MSRIVSQVDIATDTFAVHVTKTNELLAALSYEILTASNTTYGANTSGNTNVLGTLFAGTLGTEQLIGGTTGNTANISTLTVGLSNSSTSSNVVIVGYSANVNANNLNITSNTNIVSGAVNINSISTFSGNTFIRATNGVSTIGVVSNTTGRYAIVDATSVNVNAIATVVYSNTSHWGNFTLGNFGEEAGFVYAANDSSSNISIYTEVMTVESNVNIIGELHEITGNVNFAGNTLFIDYINGHVAIGHNAPAYALHAKESNTSTSIASFEHTAFDTEIELRGESGDVNGNTGVIRSGENDHLKLTSDYGNGGIIFIAANGNIGFNNSTPTSTFSTTGTASISGNVSIGQNLSVQGEATFSDSITFGDRVSFVSNTSNVTHTDISTATLIDVFNVTTYQSAKYTVTAQDRTTANNLTMAEILLVYGGDDIVYTSEYGTIYTTPSNFVSYSANANTTHVRLYVTASDLSIANSINYKLVRTTTK